MDFLILFLGAETSIVELNYKTTFKYGTLFINMNYLVCYIYNIYLMKKLLIYYYLEQSNKELFVIIIKIKFEAVFS